MAYTLQELKLQGTKNRDGIVLSLYSQNKWFANHLNYFLDKRLGSPIELSHRASDLKSQGWWLGEYLQTNFTHLQCCFQAHTPVGTYF